MNIELGHGMIAALFAVTGCGEVLVGADGEDPEVPGAPDEAEQQSDVVAVEPGGLHGVILFSAVSMSGLFADWEADVSIVEQVGPCTWKLDNDGGRSDGILSAGVLTAADEDGRTLVRLEPTELAPGLLMPYFQVMPPGSWVPGANVIFEATGDPAGFPAFRAEIKNPDTITVTSPSLSEDPAVFQQPPTFDIRHDEDFIVTWTGGSPNDMVTIWFGPMEGSDPTWSMRCIYPAEDGVGVVPQLALSLMTLNRLAIQVFPSNEKRIFQRTLEILDHGYVVHGHANHVR